MTVFLLSFICFLLVVAGMAIGVIVGDKPVRGSCGGMGAVGIDTGCDICAGKPTLCERPTRRATAAQPALAYEADEHQ